MNKQEILVIDDEPQIQKLLSVILTNEDYAVRQAATAKEGLLLAAQYQPALILLDIGLPDESGHAVLHSLRTWYSRPIVMLSVQNSEADIVQALDSGATDYLTKPFRTGELLARIRACLRRQQQSETQSPLRIFGDLSIDLSTRTAKRGSELLKLTPTEYKLLELFIANEGKVLTHPYLLKTIWGISYQTETQYLRVFVGQLRKKTEENPHQPQHLLTESGIGYRFV